MSREFEGDAGVSVIPVHVTNLPAAPPVAKLRYRTVYNTVILSADDPVLELLPDSDFRVSATVQALDADVVIGNNKAQGGRGSGTVIMASNTSPWPVCDSTAVYVAAVAALTGATTIRVSISAVYLGG